MIRHWVIDDDARNESDALGLDDVASDGKFQRPTRTWKAEIFESVISTTCDHGCSEQVSQVEAFAVKSKGELDKLCKGKDDGNKQGSTKLQISLFNHVNLTNDR